MVLSSLHLLTWWIEDNIGAAWILKDTC